MYDVMEWVYINGAINWKLLCKCHFRWGSLEGEGMPLKSEVLALLSAEIKDLG